MLAYILFIVMINDIGFDDQKNDAGELITSKGNLELANEIHLKFVDYLTLAEAINLPKQWVKSLAALSLICLLKKKKSLQTITTG